MPRTDDDTRPRNRFDAIVIGGGPAGLSAALVLGRSRRRVLVMHDGPTRNAPSVAAHSVFTRDGTSPAELLRIGREQLVPYGIRVRDERVSDVERTAGGFIIRLEGGDRLEARKIVLATGVRDILPSVPGLGELWGTGVFHCPYCHGWEVAGRPLAVYGRGQVGFDLVQLLLGWSRDLMLFTDGPDDLTAEQRAQLERNGVGVREEKVARFIGSGGHLQAVSLEGGEDIPRKGLFLKPAQELRSELPHRLGCELTSDGRVDADASGRTSVPGVYVAGDAAPGPQQVITAASGGLAAAMSLNHDLLVEDFVEGVAVDDSR